MSEGGDVAIVGGGIAGLACAYELAKRGARAVVLEYGKTGMQATNSAAGMLSPLGESAAPGPMLELGVRAMRGYPALVRELESACGFGLELRTGGILKVALDQEDDARSLRRRFAWQREMGFAVDWLDGAACRELEPRLSEHVVAGVFSQEEASVSNQLVALALERAEAGLGARVVERAGVRGFVRRRGRVTGVRTADATYPCDAVVLAAGARSGQLARHLRLDLPVVPVRGQMIALGGMSTPVRHVVWGPDGYLVPRANGLLFAGATVERVGFRRRTTAAGVRGMRRTAAALVPQLAAAKMHFAWAGLRPGTADGLPIIGALPGYENAYAATGHYRNGILLGPLTGELVARGIVESDWSGVPAACAARRFAESGESSAVSG